MLVLSESTSAWGADCSDCSDWRKGWISLGQPIEARERERESRSFEVKQHCLLSPSLSRFFFRPEPNVTNENEKFHIFHHYNHFCCCSCCWSVYGSLLDNQNNKTDDPLPSNSDQFLPPLCGNCVCVMFALLLHLLFKFASCGSFQFSALFKTFREPKNVLGPTTHGWVNCCGFAVE